MKIVRLMSAAQKKTRKSVYKKVLNESQWKARYRKLVWWYFKKAEQDSYRTFAVFTVL